MYCDEKKGGVFGREVMLSVVELKVNENEKMNSFLCLCVVFVFFVFGKSVHILCFFFLAGLKRSGFPEVHFSDKCPVCFIHIACHTHNLMWHCNMVHTSVFIGLHFFFSLYSKGLTTCFMLFGIVPSIISQSGWGNDGVSVCSFPVSNTLGVRFPVECQCACVPEAFCTIYFRLRANFWKKI